MSSPGAEGSADSASDQPTALTGKDVAVVVCAYTEERWHDIVEAIESLLAQSERPGEIVLVVDHNEALLERARNHFGEDVATVPNTHKQGLSGARNTGIASSKAEIVAFLDDDAVAGEEWVAQLLAPYANPAVVGVGGLVDPIWLSEQPAWWPAEFNWVVGGSFTGMPTTTQQIRNPIGANMSVRRVAFETAGGFNPAMGRVGKHPVGCEETEFYIRVSQRMPETKVIYSPAAAVRHKVPAARANFTYFRHRCFAEGLSKAMVSKLVGATDGLSNEREYTLKTLPGGVLRGLARGVTGRPDELRKAAAIVAGLGITTAGYLRGKAIQGPGRNLTEVPTSTEAA